MWKHLHIYSFIQLLHIQDKQYLEHFIMGSVMYFQFWVPYTNNEQYAIVECNKAIL